LIITRYIIFEPEAKSQGGHYYHVAKGLKDEAAAMGFECKLIVHSSMHIDEDSATPLFRMGYWRTNYSEEASRLFEKKGFFREKISYRRISFRAHHINPTFLKFQLLHSAYIHRIKQKFVKIILTPFRFITYFLDKISPILKTLDFINVTMRIVRSDPGYKNSHIVIPTANSNEIDAVRIISKLYPNIMFHIFIRAVYSEPITSESKRSFDKNFNSTKLGKSLISISDQIRRNRISLYTDTNELKYLFQDASGMKFTMTGVPTVQPSNNAESLGEFHISFLGDSRQEKGFQHLPPIVDGVSNLMPEVSFLIQVAGLKKSGKDGITNANLLEMQEAQLGPNHLRLIHGDLNADDYQEILFQSKIVLLPYDPSNYVRRSSGIFFEAIFNSCIPSIPTGTTLSRTIYLNYGNYLKSKKNTDLKKIDFQGNRLHRTYFCEQNRAHAFTFDFKDSTASFLKIIVKDVDSQNEDVHLIMHDNQLQESSYAIPLNPDFQNIILEISKEDGSSFNLTDVSFEKHDMRVSFFGPIYDSPTQIVNRLQYIYSNYHPCLEAIKFCADALQKENTYSNAFEKIVNNSSTI
jgi:hypothetical protein